MKFDVEKFGERLEDLRISRGLTQQDIADKMFITQGAYSHIAAGRTNVTVEQIFMLADILGTTPSFLIGDVPDNNTNNLINDIEKTLTKYKN